jgi:hypothetical protein
MRSTVVGLRGALNMEYAIAVCRRRRCHGNASQLARLHAVIPRLLSGAAGRLALAMREHVVCVSCRNRGMLLMTLRPAQEGARCRRALQGSRGPASGPGASTRRADHSSESRPGSRSEAFCERPISTRATRISRRRALGHPAMGLSAKAKGTKSPHGYLPRDMSAATRLAGR